MTVGLPALAAPRAAGSALRGAGLVLFVAATLLILVLPPGVFGYLSYRQFEFFRFTYYIPYEALTADLRAGDPARIFHSPLFTANMTSGLPIANMFTLTIGQLALSLALAAAIALNLGAALAARRAVEPVGLAGLLAAIGLSLAATAAASATGLVGCHPGLAGGLVTLLGVDSQSAAALATAAPLGQGGLILLLLLTWRWLQRRLA